MYTAPGACLRQPELHGSEGMKERRKSTENRLTDEANTALIAVLKKLLGN
jgi:hypothetical protein